MPAVKYVGGSAAVILPGVGRVERNGKPVQVEDKRAKALIARGDFALAEEKPAPKPTAPTTGTKKESE